MKNQEMDAILPNVYTVLGMAERGLKGYSIDGTYQHHAIVLENTRCVIEYAPDMLQLLKDIEDSLCDLYSCEPDIAGEYFGAKIHQRLKDIIKLTDKK